jgi:hypothetical protein
MISFDIGYVFNEVLFIRRYETMLRERKHPCYPKNILFLAIILSEKLTYLENGRVFFRTAFVEIHQTLFSIAYVKILNDGL